MYIRSALLDIDSIFFHIKDGDISIIRISNKTTRLQTKSN